MISDTDRLENSPIRIVNYYLSVHLTLEPGARATSAATAARPPCRAEDQVLGRNLFLSFSLRC